MVRNIVLAKGTGITGFTDLSAAAVNAEVDTALADIHLDHLIAVADPGSVVANNSFLAKLVSKSATATFTTYDNNYGRLPLLAASVSRFSTLSPVLLRRCSSACRRRWRWRCATSPATASVTKAPEVSRLSRLGTRSARATSSRRTGNRWGRERRGSGTR